MKLPSRERARPALLGVNSPTPVAAQKAAAPCSYAPKPGPDGASQASKACPQAACSSAAQAPLHGRRTRRPSFAGILDSTRGCPGEEAGVDVLAAEEPPRSFGSPDPGRDRYRAPPSQKTVCSRTALRQRIPAGLREELVGSGPRRPARPTARRSEARRTAPIRQFARTPTPAGWRRAPRGAVCQVLPVAGGMRPILWTRRGSQAARASPGQRGSPIPPRAPESLAFLQPWVFKVDVSKHASGLFGQAT
jgi:hypothetical protein